MKLRETADSTSPVMNRLSWNYPNSGRVESGLDKAAVSTKQAKVHVKPEIVQGFYNAKAWEANHRQPLSK